MVISLKKKTAEWWDGLTKEKSYKRFIKTDFAKWCEEEDREYTGDMAPADGMDGMDFGGMGGMGMGGMGMDGMGSFGDSDDEDDDEDADMSDLSPADLPPLESADLGDGPPPLEGGGGDGPPPLEPDVSMMKEVD